MCAPISLRREDIDRLGVTVHEKAGTARFVDPHTIETESGLRLQADKIILCAGGMSRRLSVPGFELTATHSDAWSLTAVPPSMLVVGAGATGVQLASIFNAFGSRGPALPGRTAHPADRGRRRVGGRRGRLPRRRASWCARASAPSNRSRRRRAAYEWSSRRTAHGTVLRPRSPSSRWAGWPTPPG